MKNPLLQIESIATRFDLVCDVHEDPTYFTGLAVETASHAEVWWQLVLAPAIEHDDKMPMQVQARSGLRHPFLARSREFIQGPNWGLLIADIPAGKYFSQISETLRDELYLTWLAQALSILASVHRRGSLHLAMNERSWWLLPEQEGQEEHLFLSDLCLFPDLPLGRRVQAPAIVAVAPEIWSGESVDARADLYSLATIFLRQRSQSGFQRFDTPKKLLDLHRGGRMADLVPKTASPLNDLLRRMLQLNPLDRPASALECLREIRGDAAEAEVDSARPWNESRHRRRQLTLVLSMLHTLLMEGEWDTARAWLDEIRPRLESTHGPYLEYLESYLMRHLKPEDGTNYPWERKVVDPRLRVLLKIEKSDWERRQVHPERSLLVLEDALSDLEAYTDPELAARILLKRARLKQKRERETEALDDLWEAAKKTEGIPGGRLRESICAELAEVFLKQDLEQGACVLLGEAIALTKTNPAELARLQILQGLSLMKLERWEEAGRAFYEGKSGFSAQKQLDNLIWASSHEVRLFLAQGDFARARREFRILLVRAKDYAHYADWLDLLHLAVWMDSGELPTPETEGLAMACIEGARFEAFQESAFSPAAAASLLSRVARRLNREDLFQHFSEIAERYKQAWQSTFEKFSRIFWELPPTGPGPLPEAVAQLAETMARATIGVGEESQQLHSELWQAREKLKELEEENRRLKKQESVESSASIPESVPESIPEISVAPKKPAAVPKARPAAKPSAAPRTKPEKAAPADEKDLIVESLRRNMGNREKTASELGINRRTLFAKLERYGLKEMSFQPTKQEVLAALDACGGKKNDVAQQFGMSRSTFYRFLKDLGIG